MNHGQIGGHFDNTPAAAGYGFNQKAAQQQTAAYERATENCPPSPQRESEAALQRIVHQMEIMNNYSQRASGVADRLVGSRPKDVGASSASTAPGNFSAKLHVLADALSRINADMAETADRLESFV